MLSHKNHGRLLQFVPINKLLDGPAHEYNCDTDSFQSFQLNSFYVVVNSLMTVSFKVGPLMQLLYALRALHKLEVLFN